MQQMKSLDSLELLERIESTFPIVEMPASEELPFATLNERLAGDLIRDLEEFRGKVVTVALIRGVHQEMTHLSPQAWRWILPHYLRFCMTPEAERSRLEMEFLIYNLRPRAEFQHATLERMSLLTEDQVACVLTFLRWCLNSSFWMEYCPDDISEAIGFLESNLGRGTFARNS